MILKIDIYRLLLIMMLFTAGCGEKQGKKNIPKAPEIPETSLNIQFSRFESEIFTLDIPVSPDKIREFRNRYGEFFDIWCVNLAGIIPPSKDKPDDQVIADNLSQYISDKYIREVYNETSQKFKDIPQLEKNITDMFKRYQVIFPGKTIPAIVTYISPFTSNIVAMDSIAGIGLHFYLGNNYQYYPTLGLPRYMIRKFEPEYILPDLIKGWLDSEYSNDTIQRNLLNQMIYQGKILYATDLLAPELDDSLKIGFTAGQLNWVEQNEFRTWTFLIEEKLLYSTNPREFMKYINDGNSTGGFPEDAPAKLAVYTGWQIVRAYMKNNPAVSVQQLFNNQDAQSILSSSGYKPEKIKS